MRKIYIDTKISIHGYKDIYATLVLDMHETYYVMVMTLILDLSCSCVYMLYTSYECSMLRYITHTSTSLSRIYTTIYNDILYVVQKIAEVASTHAHQQ